MSVDIWSRLAWFSFSVPSNPFVTLLNLTPFRLENFDSQVLLLSNCVAGARGSQPVSKWWFSVWALGLIPCSFIDETNLRIGSWGETVYFELYQRYFDFFPLLTGAPLSCVCIMMGLERRLAWLRFVEVIKPAPQLELALARVSWNPRRLVESIWLAPTERLALVLIPLSVHMCPVYSCVRCPWSIKLRKALKMVTVRLCTSGTWIKNSLQSLGPTSAGSLHWT